MKILIISGTPKQNGICDSLVKAAALSASGSGAGPEIIDLAAHKLPHCAMCGDGWGICRSEHKCALDDKFNGLQEKMRGADAFIYITPVYWGDVSEALKNYLDKLRRCQASKRWGDAGDSHLGGKPSIIVASAGGSGNGIVNTFVQLERAVSHMGGRVYDYIAVNRWNQEYKREALKSAVEAMIKEKRA